MSVNHVARVALLAAGWIAGLSFCGLSHQASFDGVRTTRHTQVGWPSSPWLNFDSVSSQQDGTRFESAVTLKSWSWVALAVSAAAFWARRRFTLPEADLTEDRSPTAGS